MKIPHVRTCLVAFTSLFALVAPAAAAAIAGGGGLTVTVSESGTYEVTLPRFGWTFSGEAAGGFRDVATGNGEDALGRYHAIEFHWRSGPARSGSIRVYEAASVVLFSSTADAAVDHGLPAWPEFTTVPPSLHGFSYRNAVFAPHAFRLERNGTPWLLFGADGHAVVISPAAEFMLASMVGDGSTRVGCGLNDGVAHLPAGFTQRALVAFGDTVNAAWDGWGAALDAQVGRHRPANDGDVFVGDLGYWTDNGATYYYNYDLQRGYAGTLEAVMRHYAERGIPLRYLQLDSWWYEKSLTGDNGQHLKPKNSRFPAGKWNRYGGLLEYTADPAVLPDGLAGFQRKVGLPLVTHNRWVDPASPYRERYKFSGYAGIDPTWWQHIMGYLADAGVGCYEQDWLNVIYNHSPELGTVPGQGEAFAGGMARAAAARGMSVQYCMPLPRFFLQGACYDNVTTVRVSGDRFGRDRWDNFLYTSRLASAVGIWPWTDVFMSTEKGNLLLAELSAGMVGVGDAIGQESPENLRRVSRADGVLIKPDVPIVPADQMYLDDATGASRPMVAWTYTAEPGQRTAYVFVYRRKNGPATATFVPAKLGFTGDVVVLDQQTGAMQAQPADRASACDLSGADWKYYEVAPVTSAGFAFFGDANADVSAGRKRIADIAVIPGGLRVTVVFAAGEKSVRLFGYSRRTPHIAAVHGSAGAPAAVHPDGRFEFDVAPDTGASAAAGAAEATREAVVDITG